MALLVDGWEITELRRSLPGNTEAGPQQHFEYLDLQEIIVQIPISQCSPFLIVVGLLSGT